MEFELAGFGSTVIVPSSCSVELADVTGHKPGRVDDRQAVQLEQPGIA
jgi:hypothetical protein